MASEAAKKAARARAKAQLDAAKAGKTSGLRPKLPLGERPKQISKLAQSLRKDPTTLTGGKYNKQVSPSEAAAAAGNVRAFAKASKPAMTKAVSSTRKVVKQATKRK
jgi:hypothetical protein